MDYCDAPLHIKIMKSEKDIGKILKETKILVNEDNGLYDCDLGDEFNSHEWYTIDEAEKIIENALAKT